jgi:hypothetical protein
MAVESNKITRFMNSHFFSLKLQFNEIVGSFYQAFQVRARRRNEERWQTCLSGMVEGRKVSEPAKEKAT